MQMMSEEYLNKEERLFLILSSISIRNNIGVGIHTKFCNQARQAS